MAEYIERERVYNALKAKYCDECTFADKECYRCAYADVMYNIDIMPAADVQPVRKWVNDDIYSPSTDGDYLVFYRGFFHVFERFKGKWYDEDRCDVITDLDKLWWQELPPIPDATKG